MKQIISLRDITKVFEEVPGNRLLVLEKIDLDVHEGEFLMLLGPSGSGKSTLLRIMSGLDSDYRGSVALAPDITPNDMSFVFQQFALLPWLTIYENIEIGLIARGIPPHRRQVLVHRELERFGLSPFSRHHPRELSGGMRQRVGIARALVTNPKVMFMDEPFSELDSFTAEELRKDLLSVWQDRGMTIVMVSHIIPEAIELADRIAVFTPLPGRLEHVFENKLRRPRLLRSSEAYELEDKVYKAIKP